MKFKVGDLVTLSKTFPSIHGIVNTLGIILNVDENAPKTTPRGIRYPYYVFWIIWPSENRSKYLEWFKKSDLQKVNDET